MIRHKSMKVEDTIYPLNYWWENVIECDRICRCSNISENEKILAVIYRLFGEKGLKARYHHAELLEKSQKFFLCGKNPEDNKHQVDMDFHIDRGFINASFMSDYKIFLSDPKYKKMHWYDFNDLLNGLTEHSVLNRVRELRNYDLSEVKDDKTRQKIMEAQALVALNKKELTPEQKVIREEFLSSLK